VTPPEPLCCFGHLTLEALFEIKWRVRDIHQAIVEEDDDGETEEEEDA
jgi:hypothetical protein